MSGSASETPTPATPAELPGAAGNRDGFFPYQEEKTLQHVGIGF